MRRLFLSLTVLAAITGRGAAQPLSEFVDLKNHRKVETKVDVHFVYGAENGRPYAKALNLGRNSITIDVELTTLEDAATNRKSVIKRPISLSGYSASGDYFPEYYEMKPTWISGWSVRPSPARSTAPADREPKPFLRIPPPYPVDCLYAEIEGGIVVTFDVSATGNTENIVPLGVTDQCFIEATQLSVGAWLYEPALKGGRPARREDLRTVVRFVLAQ